MSGSSERAARLGLDGLRRLQPGAVHEDDDAVKLRRSGRPRRLRARTEHQRPRPSRRGVPPTSASRAMFWPISSSGTAWIAPPEARAVAIARSPSAGLPIRERLGDRSSSAAARPVAPRRTPSPRARSPPPGRRCGRGRLVADQPDAPELLESLPELWRASRPGRSAPPTASGTSQPSCPCEIERERLRALRVVGAQVHVDRNPQSTSPARAG